MMDFKNFSSQNIINTQPKTLMINLTLIHYIPCSFCNKGSWHYCCILEAVEMMDFEGQHQTPLLLLHLDIPHTDSGLVIVNEDLLSSLI